MVYVERQPAAPLNGFVRMLWHAWAPGIAEERQRVLPDGCVQIVINLARDYVWECSEAKRERTLAPSLIVGARTRFEVVDTSDMTDLVGIIFHPGGFGPFVKEPVDVFSNENVPLEDVWGSWSRELRDRLREATAGLSKLCLLERLLVKAFAARLVGNPAIEFALRRFAQAPAACTVAQVARETGLSVRHFSQMFREQVGLSPKVWCRVRRFQRVVRELHSGADVPWAELALDCGYYDQAHFANEFRAFSGIDATSYSVRRTVWANHVPVD